MVLYNRSKQYKCADETFLISPDDIGAKAQPQVTNCTNRHERFPSTNGLLDFLSTKTSYLPPAQQVYITCSVILCEPESPFSRCAQGCLTDAARRRKRSLSRETTSRQIIQGPFQFPKQDVHLASVENTFNYVVLDSDTSIVG